MIVPLEKPSPEMSESADKARALKLERLKSMVEGRLQNPAAALDVLLSELRSGAPQSGLWEALHGASLRDGQEAALASAYQKITHERKLQPFEPWAQVEVLMHAADFFQGVMGDGAAAEGFLERVLLVAPQHADAFRRLERRALSIKDKDPRRLVELYALVASGQPRTAGDLVTKAINLIVPLSAALALSEVACKRLVKLVGTHPTIVDTLDAHCRKTKRPDLACALLEEALLDPALPKSIDQRRRLIELYTSESSTPGKAIAHVEELLNADPGDAVARAGAERLLSVREVAPKAAAALQQARRQARSGSGSS
jgi:hypothetical protein